MRLVSRALNRPSLNSIWSGVPMNAGDPGLERRALRRGAGQPLAEVVEPTLLDLGEERERHVQLVAGGPPEGCRVAADLEERVQVLDRHRRRDDSSEEPHQPICVPRSEPIR